MPDYQQNVVKPVSHNLEAERNSRGQPRGFMLYDSLLQDWRGATQQLSTDLGLHWPRLAAEAAPDIDSFLNGTYRHNRADHLDNRSIVHTWASQVRPRTLDWQSAFITDWPGSCLNPPSNHVWSGCLCGFVR